MLLHGPDELSEHLLIEAEQWHAFFILSFSPYYYFIHECRIHLNQTELF